MDYLQRLGTEVRESQFRQVVDLAVKYHDGAVNCADDGHFHAACILIGAAMEAELLAMAFAFENELKGNPWWPKGRPETWDLVTLTNLALETGWLPSRDPDSASDDLPSRGDVVEMLDFVRDTRNRAAHPGRCVRDFGPEPDQATYETAFRIVRTTFDHTYARLQSPLR